MNNLIAEISDLVGLGQSAPSGGVESLLAGMSPSSVKSLRLVAIPHQFDIFILRVLEPGLNGDVASFLLEELSLLPIIVIADGEYAVRDDARSYLFKQWLAGPELDEFSSASCRLAQYFKARMDEEKGSLKHIWELDYVFHLLGENLDTGFENGKSSGMR
ncbi:hypothetical protein [Massilia sp. METH4]|uniref:hypothetical protein n=1 Tax=Massilia sp. METH4 TaxID=3123041 RepID=UPI0030D254CF